MCAHIGLGLHQENHATHTQSPIMPHVEVTNYKQHVAGNSKQHMGKQSALTLGIYTAERKTGESP